MTRLAAFQTTLLLSTFALILTTAAAFAHGVPDGGHCYNGWHLRDGSCHPSHSEIGRYIALTVGSILAFSLIMGVVVMPIVEALSGTSTKDEVSYAPARQIEQAADWSGDDFEVIDDLDTGASESGSSKNEAPIPF